MGKMYQEMIKEVFGSKYSNIFTINLYKFWRVGLNQTSVILIEGAFSYYSENTGDSTYNGKLGLNW
jgi:hypothetical protein